MCYRAFFCVSLHCQLKINKRNEMPGRKKKSSRDEKPVTIWNHRYARGERAASERREDDRNNTCNNNKNGLDLRVISTLTGD